MLVLILSGRVLGVILQFEEVLSVILGIGKRILGLGRGGILGPGNDALTLSSIGPGGRGQWSRLP